MNHAGGCHENHQLSLFVCVESVLLCPYWVLSYPDWVFLDTTGFRFSTEITHFIVRASAAGRGFLQHIVLQ